MDEENENSITGCPRVVPYECSKTIIEQMEKNICKITVGDEQGTGFFCEIPFPNKDNMLKVLITNNHVINDSILKKPDAVIPLDIEEEANTKYLNLNNRIKYTSEKYDTTIIELKENDEIKNYLQLDEKIMEDIMNNINKNDKYKDETVYIIQYPEGKLSVSYGIIGNMCVSERYNITHKCSTNRGSSGSPILNINNNKVIGIHKKAKENKYNKGTFLNFPIKEFIQQCHINKNEENKKNKFENEHKKEEKGISLMKSEIYDNITKDNMEELMQIQLKRSVCFVEIGENKWVTGFLCLIPLFNGKKIRTLITSGSYVNEKILNNEISINLIFDDGKISVKMRLNKDRIIFINKTKNNNEIMIIEIKEDDIDNYGNCLIKSNYFLELDENSMIHKNYETYSNKLAYMLKYVYSKSFKSIGKVLSIDENEEIAHLIDSGEGSMGSPILNLNTLKVFGMHISIDKSKKIKYGRMLHSTVNEFIHFVNSNPTNYWSINKE